MATINFNDKIFAQQILQQVTKKIPPLMKFARNFSSETGRVGDAIAVPLIGACSATTFSQSDNSGNPYEQSGGQADAVTVTLDKQHIVPVDITDLQAVSQSPAQADLYAVQAGNALANRVFQVIASLVTSVNFGAIVTTLAAASWGTTQARLVKKTLDQRDVSPDNRSLFIPTDVMDAFLGDGLLNAAYAYGSAVLPEGRIPRLLGMDVVDLNNIPLNGISLLGWAQHPDAIAVAMRALPPQDTSMLSAYEVLSEPQSGFTFNYRRHYNPGSGKQHINLEALFGMTKGVTLALALFTKP